MALLNILHLLRHTLEVLQPQQRIPSPEIGVCYGKPRLITTMQPVRKEQMVASLLLENLPDYLVQFLCQPVQFCLVSQIFPFLLQLSSEDLSEQILTVCSENYMKISICGGMLEQISSHNPWGRTCYRTPLGNSLIFFRLDPVSTYTIFLFRHIHQECDYFLCCFFVA